MSITLREVQENEKNILGNLYSFYLHDLSKFTSHIQINKYGFFEFEDLHTFWTTDGISPYFIKYEENIVGFILLLERPFLKKENDFSINDIFILNQYKGRNIGIQAVEALFKIKKGEYYIIELINNTPAVSFWKKIYNKLNIDFHEKQQIIDDELCLVQSFNVQ